MHVVGGMGSLGELFREARRQAGLTQLQVARQVGCTQSAISMFEAGRADVLSVETQRKIAELLGIDPELLVSEQVISAKPPLLTLKFCPVAECLSNIPYVVNGRLCFRPVMVEGVKGGREWCRNCGEILEESCPNERCGSDVYEGAFCRKCGTPYVQWMNVPPEKVLEWADAQRARIQEIQTLLLSERGNAQKGRYSGDILLR